MTTCSSAAGDRQALVGFLVPTSIALLVSFGVLVTSGVPLMDVIAYAAYVAFVIVLPGRLLWRWLWEGHRESGHTPYLRTGLEDWVFGAATGYALELLTYPLARLAGQPRLYVAVPLVILLVLGVRARRRGEIARAHVGWPVGLLMSGVVSYLMIWLSTIVFGRVPISGRYWPSDEDEPFHLSLIGELRHHFPPEYPYIDAGPLTYQWFVHAHMAASTWITGIEPLVVYRRFDPLVLSVLAVLGAAVLTIRLSGRAWAGPVAAGLLVLVGSFDITGTALGEAAPEERFLEGGILLNSPTQALAFAFIPPVIVLCLELLRVEGGNRSGWRLFLGLAIGLVVVSGTKATVLPVIMAGFLTAAGVEWWRHRQVPRAAITGLAASSTALVASAQWLYAGDSYSLRFQPGKSTDFFMERLGMEVEGNMATFVVAAALLTMWLMSAAGLVGLFLSPELRWDPRLCFLLGACLSGLGALFLLGHEGMSQLYFGRTVAPLLAALSAWGVATMYPPGTSRRTGAVALLISLFGGFTLLTVRFVTESWREPLNVGGETLEYPALRLWLNFPVVLLLLAAFAGVRLVLKDLSKGTMVLAARSLVVFLLGLGLARSMAFAAGHFPPANIEEGTAGIAPGGVVAARWLQAHSRPDDRVITNAHCLPRRQAEEPCDSRHFWMSAFSQRRFVLEGWAYTRFEEDWFKPYWGDGGVLVNNDLLFTRTATHQLDQFLREHNAQWLFVDHQQPGASGPLPESPRLRSVYRAGNFEIMRIR